MSSLDRLTAPASHAVAEINIIHPETFTLPNNIPVYSLGAGSQEVIKVELVFNAGSAHHLNPLVPSFTSSMLQEGTSRRNAKEIASAIDDFGAFLELDHDKDYSSVTLYSLNKYLPQTLPVILEMITESVFPQNEWDIMRSNRLQNYMVNLEKVSFLAGKRFQELIFHGTPYGAHFDESDYNSVTRDDLHEFWLSQFKLANTQILLSGNVSEAVKQSVSETFGSTIPLNFQFEQRLPEHTQVAPAERVHFIEKSDAIQSAIRIGRRLFTKDHPDYFGMKVLTTILGGYFGSRLMSNIREDKGYTYGIGAGIAAYRNEGYFYISTEVGSDVCEKALYEIYKEIRILQDELVSEEELSLVRNYLLGNLLKSFDGPFERMDRFKGAHLYGQDLSFFHKYSEAIRAIDPASLQKLANVWLQKDDLLELVAGKK